MSNGKMSADDLIGEIERIESAMEYTSATIAPGNLIQGSRADWREVHKGRANSSYDQLRNRINKIPALRAAVAALIAERDALREDAERYRWLRKFSANSAPDYVAVPTLVWAGRYDDRWLFKLDAAVDAVRANEST